MNEEHFETFFIEMKKGYETLKLNHLSFHPNFDRFFYLELMCLIIEDMARKGMKVEELQDLIHASIQGGIDRISMELKEEEK